ncbi:MAG: ribosome biogenesis protein [Candidatus Altiarchaeota archaeon]|nr:ribosome biogenesis protein [Candidatus Altiarchaeota archaeon]
MKKCVKCDSYVMSACKCGGDLRSVEPPKYSPQDKYWRQRLKAKGVKL